MSIKLAGIAIAMSAAAAVAAAAQAAEPPVKLALQKGLWQLTTQAQVSGVLPPQLQQQLQGMPAAERAKIQAAMQSAMANAQRQHIFKECMTAKRLSHGFGGADPSAQCTSTLVSNTRSDFEYHRVCAAPGGQGHTETASFHRRDSHHLTGTVDVVQSGGGRAMKVHETVAGKWLGSSCAGVKGTQIVK
jgi:hypothetical protein